MATTKVQIKFTNFSSLGSSKMMNTSTYFILSFHISNNKVASSETLFFAKDASWYWYKPP